MTSHAVFEKARFFFFKLRNQHYFCVSEEVVKCNSLWFLIKLSVTVFHIRFEAFGQIHTLTQTSILKLISIYRGNNTPNSIQGSPKVMLKIP